MSTLLALVSNPAAPRVELDHLDELWFQVSGTLCNLSCSHCFISCSPHNRSFEMLRQGTVRQALQESVGLGVKEYYFTGGEPFLHPEMVGILEETLQYGPATVLTNGTVLQDGWLERLRTAEKASIYSLEFRVSLDGTSAATNDPIRGSGTFERILGGIRKLVRAGFMPIVTVTQTRDEQDEALLFQEFLTLLKGLGYERPRVKILPTLRLGAETSRQRGYGKDEVVTLEMMESYDPGQLLCSRARVVTDRGIWVCPILLDAADARLGDTLAEASSSFGLSHRACFTCYHHGSVCANPSANRQGA